MREGVWEEEFHRWLGLGFGFVWGLAAAMGVFNLEDQFSFYGAYHHNKINVLIHIVFVWPIYFSASTLLAYTPPLAPQLPIMAALPCHDYMVLNYSFLLATVYALFYISLEPKSGSVGAFLVLLCWMGSNAVAQHLPYALGWKVSRGNPYVTNLSRMDNFLLPFFRFQNLR